MCPEVYNNWSASWNYKKVDFQFKVYTPEISSPHQSPLGINVQTEVNVMRRQETRASVIGKSSPTFSPAAKPLLTCSQRTPLSVPAQKALTSKNHSHKPIRPYMLTHESLAQLCSHSHLHCHTNTQEYNHPCLHREHQHKWAENLRHHDDAEI